MDWWSFAVVYEQKFHLCRPFKDFVSHNRNKLLSSIELSLLCVCTQRIKQMLLHKHEHYFFIANVVPHSQLQMLFRFHRPSIANAYALSQSPTLQQNYRYFVDGV